MDDHTGQNRRETDHIYVMAVEALRQASTAQTTAALATQKMADHEAVCGERWEQSRRSVSEVNNALASINKNINQLFNAVTQQTSASSQTGKNWSNIRDFVTVIALVGSMISSILVLRH